MIVTILMTKIIPGGVLMDIIFLKKGHMTTIMMMLTMMIHLTTIIPGGVLMDRKVREEKRQKLRLGTKSSLVLASHLQS